MSGKGLSGKGCGVRKKTHKTTQELLFICLIVTPDLTFCSLPCLSWLGHVALRDLS